MVEPAAEKAPLRVTERVRPTLLQINARKLENRKLKLEVCLQEAYNAYASIMLPTGELESDEVLNSLIPGWVFDNAVEFGWMPYPPQRRELREKVHENAWIPGAKTTWWANVPVSETTLVHTLGGYRVNEYYKNLIGAYLAGRVAHWKGEALKRAVGKPAVRQSPDVGNALKAARAAMKESQQVVADTLKIQRSSLQDHESGKVKPSAKTMAKYKKHYGKYFVTDSNSLG